MTQSGVEGDRVTVRPIPPASAMNDPLFPVITGCLVERVDDRCPAAVLEFGDRLLQELPDAGRRRAGGALLGLVGDSQHGRLGGAVVEAVRFSLSVTPLDDEGK